MSAQINGNGNRMKTVDHQKFLSSISNETRASLFKRTDWHGVTHLAVHWVLIILFGLAIYFALPGWQLLLVPQGILIVFLLHYYMNPSIKLRLKQVGLMPWQLR